MASIEKRGNNYKLVVSLGYDNTGKRIKKSKTFKVPSEMTPSKAKKEAERLAFIFEEECLKGYYARGNIKFSEYATYYIENYAKIHTKPKTYREYEKKLKAINLQFGNIPLVKLNARHINDLYKTLLAKGLSPKSIQGYRAVVSAILSTAYKEGVVNENVVKRSTPPKVAHIEQEFLSNEEVKRVVSNLSKVPINYRTIFIIAITTGMRLGEIMGLNLNTIDFKTNKIEVKRNLGYTSKEGMYFDTPKTNASNRVLDVPIATIEYIKEYLNWVEENKKTFGDYYKINDFFFVSEVGTPIHLTTPSGKWRKFLKEINVKHVRFHDIRHTVGTYLISTKVPVKDVSAQLGHATTRITHDYYIHATNEGKKEISNALNNLIENNTIRPN